MNAKSNPLELDLDRRSVLVATALMAVNFYSNARAAEDTVVETQRGDPDLPDEYLVYDKSIIAENSQPTKGTLEKVPSDFKQLLIAEARTWEGRNRRENKEAIAELLQLFDLPFAINNRPVPFCAAGVSYVAAMVYAKSAARRQRRQAFISSPHTYLPELDNSHFYPTPSVNDMFLVAQGKRKWIFSSTGLVPEPGWLVVFSWSGNVPNHVGIVTGTQSGSITTIEFNTSVSRISTALEREGGYVASRVRSYPSRQILGFIKTA